MEKFKRMDWSRSV